MWAAENKRKISDVEQIVDQDSDSDEDEGALEVITSDQVVESSTFAEIGVCEWLRTSVASMGFRYPTEIQRACIPAVLAGRDVIGCAETGSGKTAAFALPILHHLSEDPFGIFAVVLTPTRELGIQISEQFSSFGAPMNLRIALVIGGVNMTNQGLELSKRPHVVIATPGRLRHHLEGSDPPDLSRARYLVLDEAGKSNLKFFYTVGILCNVECCIRQLWCSSIILYMTLLA